MIKGKGRDKQAHEHTPVLTLAGRVRSQSHFPTHEQASTHVDLQGETVIVKQQGKKALLACAGPWNRERCISEHRMLSSQLKEQRPKKNPALFMLSNRCREKRYVCRLQNRICPLMKTTIFIEISIKRKKFDGNLVERKGCLAWALRTWLRAWWEGSLEKALSQIFSPKLREQTCLTTLAAGSLSWTEEAEEFPGAVYLGRHPSQMDQNQCRNR